MTVPLHCSHCAPLNNPPDSYPNRGHLPHNQNYRLIDVSLGLAAAYYQLFALRAPSHPPFCHGLAHGRDGDTILSASGLGASTFYDKFFCGGGFYYYILVCGARGDVLQALRRS